MKASIKCLLVILTLQQVVGKFVNPCSNTTEITPLQDFKIEKFTGKPWYDIKYADSSKEFIENKADEYTCCSMNFSPVFVNNSYEVNVSCLNSTDPDRKYISNIIDFSADPDYPMVHATYEKAHSILLDTDYETYQLMYGCFEYEDAIEVYATVSSTKRILDKDILDKLSSKMEQLGFLKENMHDAIQKDC